MMTKIKDHKMSRDIATSGSKDTQGMDLQTCSRRGNDIVCAAISVLGQTAAQCIMDMSESW